MHTIIDAIRFLLWGKSKTTEYKDAIKLVFAN